MDLSLEELVEILNARIEKVEFPKGQISLEKHQNKDENEGLIRVKYANVDLARFHYMRYAIIGPNGNYIYVPDFWLMLSGDRNGNKYQALSFMYSQVGTVYLKNIHGLLPIKSK